MLVLMADGSERPIENIQIGDEVCSSGGASSRVENMLRGSGRELIQIDLASGRMLRLNASQPVITTRGAKRAASLRDSDQLISNDFPFTVSIVSLSVVQGNFDVFELALEKIGEYVLEGVFVGDFYRQLRCDE